MDSVPLTGTAMSGQDEVRREARGESPQICLALSRKAIRIDIEASQKERESELLMKRAIETEGWASQAGASEACASGADGGGLISREDLGEALRQSEERYRCIVETTAKAFGWPISTA